ncbi:MAG: hypothetical protein ACR2H3_10790 [Acidimicrobiales bacterium]
MDEDLLAGIDRWIAEAAAEERAAAAAREQRETRDLLAAAAADDDLVAMLLALADAGDHLSIRLAGTTREVRGRVVALGDDFVVLRGGADDAPVFVALAGVEAVHLPPGRAWAGGVHGDQRRRRGSLRAILAGLADESPRVQLVTTGAAYLGALEQVNAEAVVIKGEATDHHTTLVPLAGITAVVLLDWT